MTPATAEGDDRIVSAVIYPSIGIARLGNSADAWFVGPEVPDPAPLPPGSYRDATGALKRQAARFLLYGATGLGKALLPAAHRLEAPHSVFKYSSSADLSDCDSVVPYSWPQLLLPEFRSSQLVASNV
jgi:hypothetical protein